jgi:hypothetical protein
MPPQPMQWQKNGQPIAGATDATFTLFSVRATDAGTYTVVTTHAHGHTSSAVVVVVTPSTVVAPAIARQPVSITVAPGSTATFNVSATDATTYQWCRDGQPIGGATNALLVIPRADSGDIGSYSVAITNSVGTTTSTAASLTISDEANFGHLTNLSVRVRITAGEPSFTVGTVIGGGTGGVKPLLVRAVGPSLTMLGVATPLADTKLELRASGVVIAENNDWGGDTVLRNAAASVGAFPLADDSKDAALFDSRLAARDYTIDVSGAGGTTGEVIAELYDASATFSVGMPRLINVSVLKRIDAGDSLTAGFVIGGRTARTVLVRAIGPGLTALNVPGILLDPQFALFDAAQIKIAENDNWGGDTELAMAGASVRAFAIADRGSKDAMLLVTLAPGSYTAQVSGGGGSVLVEVYDVP